MKHTLILITFLLTCELHAQTRIDLDENGVKIFNLFTDDNIDQIIQSYFPSKEAWNWVFSQLGISVPNYDESKVQMTNWLNEERIIAVKHNTNFENVSITKIDQIPVTTNLLKGDDKVETVKLIVSFSDGTSEYECIIGLFEFDGTLWLYPERGISWKEKY